MLKELPFEVSTTIVGQSVPRIDAKEKVTGRAKFCDDLDFADILYARILRSPYAHAKILKIDTSEAEKLEGVRGVLTPEDVPKIPYNSSWRGAFHFGVLPEDEYVLDETVRFIGDKVAAVAAEDPFTAEKALELIRVEYKELPAVFDSQEAMKPEAPKIHAKGNIARHALLNVGDVEKGLREADYIFEGSYETQRVQHCTLETHGSIASLDPFSGRLTVWSSTQVPFNIRFVLSAVLAMPMSKIRVIKPYVGGGFGGKDELFDEPIVALLSKKTGRPVKIQYSREEDIISSRTRHPSIIELKTGVKKDGTLTARLLKAITNTGAYAAAGPQVTYCVGFRWLALYRCPNMKFEGYCVYTNEPISGAYRGYGNPQSNFATETQMDEIAEKLGIDPVELRLKNVVRQGDIHPGTGWVLDSCALDECIRRGAERLGWRSKRALQRGKNRGVGMGVNVHNTNSKPFIHEHSSAVVKVNEDGTIMLLTGTAEIGTGSTTVLAQIVAETIGARFEDVTVVSGDTDATPYDLGAYASRTTHLGGNAAMMAAAKAREEFLKQASQMLRAPVEDLAVKNSQIYTKGDPSKKVTFYEVAHEIHYGDNPRDVTCSASYVPPTNAPPFAAQFAEVEVDTETGKVKVLRIVSAHDCGRAIHPELAKGQVEGAILQGIGYALTEAMIVKEGKTLNANLKDFKLPTACDMPEDVEVLLVEPYEPTGPYGAKGIAESALVSIAPAIANAIYDAIGVRIRELPITPDKILEALRENALVEGGK